MQIEDYKKIIDSISIAILVAKPVYTSENKISDFKIIYTNKSFDIVTDNLTKEGDLFSSLKNRVSHNIDFFKAASDCLYEKVPEEYIFFSPSLGKWLQLVYNRVFDDYVALTFSDVTKSKEYEKILCEQNSRLEQLTKQLATSQNMLDTQLKNIHTLNQQLLYTAYHDSLTDLYNRTWLKNILKENARTAIYRKEKIGIILFDIDNLKDVNDSRGHLAGDEIICQTANILKLIESKYIIPTRFGGDEFVILCKGVKTKEDVYDIAKKTLDLFNAEDIGLSIGISIFPDDSESIDDLLKFADMAKTDVKQHGKNNIIYFQSVMQEKFLNKLNIETKLSKAMVDKQFMLYYQPQFDVSTDKLRGFEALLRWHDDNLGWVSPEQFIPLAEETRLVIPLGEWVMDTALRTLYEWENKFNFNGIMSVNVSPVQFYQDNFIEKIIKKIDESGINRKHLEIEITEGVLIDNAQETIAKLNLLKDYGIGISLDDFGTGYSSLRYLQILPLTTLKIDKSFVSNIANSKGVEANITETIVNLVSKMGLDTIAEGVETENQLDILRKLNCKTIQGFLRGKPMPKELCEKLLQ